MLHRYPQLAMSEEAAAYQAEVDGYRHRHYPRVRLSAAAQAISCYDYQACEHPEYRDSHARAFVESLRDALLSRLPGIGDERWGINSSEQAASTTIFAKSVLRG
uniref:Uncharacterized protein n=1 Tax=Bosea sp. NBC_00436 TaxID=2969620 RepID=A0A9E8CTA4_9HYPH